MSGDRFPACLAFTLAEEGGYSNTPGDAGGATEHGITLTTFRAWRHDPHATVAQLQAITPAEVSAIYAALYFAPPRCQDMPSGVDLMVFDMGVNSGFRQSAILLQGTLGVVADGWVGTATLARLNTRNDVPGFISALAKRQAAFYRGLAGYAQFGRGWMTRLQSRQAAALHMAGATAVPILPIPPPLPSDETGTDALNDAELARHA